MKRDAWNSSLRIIVRLPEEDSAVVERELAGCCLLCALRTLQLRLQQKHNWHDLPAEREPDYYLSLRCLSHGSSRRMQLLARRTTSVVVCHVTTDSADSTAKTLPSFRFRLYSLHLAAEQEYVTNIMTTTLQEINSSVAKLRALLAEAKKDLQRIQGLQTSLVEALDGFWQASEIAHLAQSDKYWREVISLVTSGKILSAAAQADEALSAGTTVHAKPWISDGHEYSRWLGRAIADMAVGEKIPMKALVDLLRSSFSLGYTGRPYRLIM